MRINDAEKVAAIAASSCYRGLWLAGSRSRDTGTHSLRSPHTPNSRKLEMHPRHSTGKQRLLAAGTMREWSRSCRCPGGAFPPHLRCAGKVCSHAVPGIPSNFGVQLIVRERLADLKRRGILRQGLVGIKTRTITDVSSCRRVKPFTTMMSTWDGVY